MSLIRRLYHSLFAADREFSTRMREVLGYTPSHLDIYRLAFHHKSNRQWVNGDRIINNERLEFLGDSMLSAIVAEYLYEKYPNGNEGFLTKLRSRIVKRKTLNHIGECMGLDTILSEFNDTRLSRSMLGNALEALVGAIYIERGYKPTRDFVIGRMLRMHLDIDDLEKNDDNYKSQLLEWGQKENHNVEYRLLEKSKKNKRDRFRIGVFVDGKRVTQSEHFNKKSAEQSASREALAKMGILEAEGEEN